MPTMLIKKRLVLHIKGNQIGALATLRAISSIAEYRDHKQDSLSKQKMGRGHWKPELATESEAAIKSDRMAVTANTLPLAQMMKGLQDRTKATADETAKAGTSMSDGH